MGAQGEFFKGMGVGEVAQIVEQAGAKKRKGPFGA
jgi:hypothetical protein